MSNIVIEVVEQMGGVLTFSKLMGHNMNSTNLREIITGKRIPTEETRRRMVRASRGRISEADIIAITGRVEANLSHPKQVDPHWDLDEDERRIWIAERAATGARETRRLLGRRK